MALNLKSESGGAQRDPHVITLKDSVRPASASIPISNPMQPSRIRAPHKTKERVVMMVAGAGLCIVLVIAIYVTVLHSPLFAVSGEKEVHALVASVGDLILLPDNETPTVATVSDLHALEGQLFFQNAQIGDKVLIYVKAQKAILYRPSTRKIIEVGPVTGATQ